MKPKMSSLNLVLKMATEDDVEDIVYLCELFHEEAQNPQTFDPQVVTENILEAIRNYKEWLVLTLIDEDRIVGILIAVVIPSLFGTDKLAVELAWYVQPEYRVTKKSFEMVKMYEYWAKHLMGVDLISMSTLVSLDNERVGKICERMGYHKTEESYIKEVRDGSGI